jgi:hypothetical protein
VAVVVQGLLVQISQAAHQVMVAQEHLCSQLGVLLQTQGKMSEALIFTQVAVVAVATV